MDVPPMPAIGSGMESEEYQFWYEQKRRCTVGWTAPNGVWLNPILYFHLNFVRFPIIDKKGRQSGASNALYFKQDHETFDAFYYNRQLDEDIPANDIVATKSRGVHWSFNMASYLAWTLLITQESGAYIGPDEATVKDFHLFFSGVLLNIHPAFKPVKYEPNNADIIGYGVQELSGEIGTRNRIYFADVTRPKSIGALRGKRLYVVAVDEAGRYQKDYLSRFVGATRFCVELQGVKWGHMIIGGTSDKITNESADYENMYFERKVRKVSYFIPGDSMYLKYFDEHTGECDREKARTDILKERAELEAAGDRIKLHEFIQEVPLEDWECFQSPTVSGYNAAMLDAQLYRIRTEFRDALWKRGRLEFIRDLAGKKTRRVEFIPDDRGLWLLHDYGHPQDEYKNLDFAATDDYYKDQAEYSDSLGAMIVWRGEHYNVEYSDAPVCIFLGRPQTKSKLYAEFLKGLIYFGGIEVLIENNDESFALYLEKEGWGNLVRWVNGKRGVKPSDKLISEMTGLCEDYIESEAFMKCDSILIIEALKKWRASAKTNTDIGSAFHTLLLFRDILKSERTRRRQQTEEAPAKPALTWGKERQRERKTFSFQKMR